MQKKRLQFIDAARSFAILLMLEGHFIDMSLDLQQVDTSNLIYRVWYFMRGFTSPMFFSVTGLVFVYLLCEHKAAGFSANIRVRKGFRRAVELFAWGVLLQLNLRYYGELLAGRFSSWMFAFHVLHCISFGLMLLLLFYGLYRLFPFIPLFLWYAAGGTGLFLLRGLLDGWLGGGYWLPEAHPMIQNIVRGPDSVFPLVPWAGFVLFGGMCGALVHRWKDWVGSHRFSFGVLAAGILLQYYAWDLLALLDTAFAAYDTHFTRVVGMAERFAQVLMALGVLMYLDPYMGPANGWYFRVGRQSLPVYLLHVIVLYGGITGWGLINFYEDALPPAQAIFGAVCFVGSFVLLAYHYHHVDAAWARFKQRVGLAPNKKTGA